MGRTAFDTAFFAAQVYYNQDDSLLLKKGTELCLSSGVTPPSSHTGALGRKSSEPSPNKLDPVRLQVIYLSGKLPSFSQVRGKEVRVECFSIGRRKLSCCRVNNFKKNRRGSSFVSSGFSAIWQSAVQIESSASENEGLVEWLDSGSGTKMLCQIAYKWSDFQIDPRRFSGPAIIMEVPSESKAVVGGFGGLTFSSSQYQCR